MLSHRRLILASQSAQRQELLAGLGLEFEVIPADLDELAIDDPDHALRAAKVAGAKAQKISQLYPEAIIIAADTFILLDGQRLEKPLDLDEARQMLSQLSGRTVTVYTGWAYHDPAHHLAINQANLDQLSFRPLSPSHIETYVISHPVTRWAGAFTLSHLPGMALIARLEGSLTSVLGLPLEALIPHLKTSGILV